MGRPVQGPSSHRHARGTSGDLAEDGCGVAGLRQLPAQDRPRDPDRHPRARRCEVTPRPVTGYCVLSSISCLSLSVARLTLPPTDLSSWTLLDPELFDVS